jgi:SAM-dependent methyltransferase
MEPSILDQYVRTAPSPQTMLDIFRGEWSSRMPEPLSDYHAGSNNLFNPKRLQRFFGCVGGVAGKSVLELGPLEGGHTWALEQAGTARIVAIEANNRAFLKCLIVKELLGLRARFLLGDFMEYLRQDGEVFDVVIAAGVLYHMQNPAELLARIARRCTESVFIWTHYYDPDLLTPKLRVRFRAAEEREYEGFRHALYEYEYENALDWRGFCGGSETSSRWMTLKDIVRCCEHFGLSVTELNRSVHPHGPVVVLAAQHSK